MITRNDQKTGLCNGDTAVVENGEAHFTNGLKPPLHQLPPYEYAYAISVHKSQGSEYDHVLFLMPEGSDSFGKEVIYTAVTRAKEKVDIDGDLETIEKALATNYLN